MGFLEMFAAFFLAFAALKIVSWAFMGLLFHIFLSDKWGGPEQRKTFKEKVQERLAQEDKK